MLYHYKSSAGVVNEREREMGRLTAESGADRTWACEADNGNSAEPEALNQF